jgi:hypothetical protein
VKLWHQFGGGLNCQTLGLEVLDPKGAEVLVYFAEFCKKKMGGPIEVFNFMDADHSDSLEIDELAEGLEGLGFFDEPDLPAVLNSKEQVSKNLYPLLDQSGYGCIQAEQMLFLEQDLEKRSRLTKEIRRAQQYGHVVGGIETTSDAEKLLNKVCMDETQLGGRFWKMINANNVLPSSPMVSPRLGSRFSSALPSRVVSPRGMSRRASCSRSQLTSPLTSPKSMRRHFPTDDMSPMGSRSCDSPGGFGGTSSIAASPMVTGGFPSSLPSMSATPMVSGLPSPMVTGGFSGFSSAVAAGAFPVMSRSFSESGQVDGHVGMKSSARRDRLACLASSMSLPQLPTTSPEIAANLRKTRAKKNNEQIRRSAAQKLRGPRSIYGGALVTPLPEVRRQDPMVPAKASLIFPDVKRRGLRPGTTEKMFDPRRSVPMDFFRSTKSKSLFDAYH